MKYEEYEKLSEEQREIHHLKESNDTLLSWVKVYRGQACLKDDKIDTSTLKGKLMHLAGYRLSNDYVTGLAEIIFQSDNISDMNENTKQYTSQYTGDRISKDKPINNIELFTYEQLSKYAEKK